MRQECVRRNTEHHASWVILQVSIISDLQTFRTFQAFAAVWGKPDNPDCQVELKKPETMARENEGISNLPTAHGRALRWHLTSPS
jgi:hypothetical protein